MWLTGAKIGIFLSGCKSLIGTVKVYKKIY